MAMRIDNGAADRAGYKPDFVGSVQEFASIEDLRCRERTRRTVLPSCSRMITHPPPGYSVKKFLFFN